MSYRYCSNCGAALSPAADLHVPQHCAACGTMHYQNAKPCAGALIVRGGRVLLVRRALDPAKGCWDVPGGFLHADEHPEDGAKREALEETGLTVRLTGLFGIYIDPYGEGSDIWTMIVYYMAEAIDDSEPCAADDAAEIRWFAPEELPERMAFAHEDQLLAKWRAYQNGVSSR